MRDTDGATYSTSVAIGGIEHHPLYRGLGVLRLYAILVVAWSVFSFFLPFATWNVLSPALYQWRSLGFLLVGIGFLLLFATGVFKCIGRLYAEGDRLRNAFVLLISLTLCWRVAWLVERGAGIAGRSFLDYESLYVELFGYLSIAIRLALMVVLVLAASKLNSRFGGSLIRCWTFRLFVFLCFAVVAASYVPRIHMGLTPSFPFVHWTFLIQIGVLLIELGLYMRAIVLLGRAQRHLTLKNRCLACGYDLTANETGVCSECGTATAEWLSGSRPSATQL